MRIYKPTRKGARGASIAYARWYVELRDHREIVRRVAGFTDKGATEELGRKLERLAQLKAGGEGPTGELARYVETMPERIRERLAAWGILGARQLVASRPLPRILEEWRASLVARETTAEHVERTFKRVRALFGACGFTTLSSVSARAVERHLRGLREGDPQAVALHLRARGAMPEFTRRRERARLLERGLGAKASNHYLAAARQFMAWAIGRGYASEDALRVLHPLNARVDRRHLRRALSEEELVRLVQAAHDGPTLGAVPGPVRALLYVVAVETGLRASELKALRVASFSVDEGSGAFVELPARATKNREDARIALRATTARALAGFLAGRGALEPAFGLPAAWRPPRALLRDLESARIAYVDESGRRFDFHALRGMQGTRLLAHGANPRAAQTLMRHATADMTLSVYAKLRPDEERRALDLLPDLLPRGAEGARATGTAGAPWAPESVASSVAFRAASSCSPVHSGRPASAAQAPRTAFLAPAVVEDRGLEPLTS